MNKVGFKIFLIIFTLFNCLNIEAQHVPFGLELKDVQNKLINKTIDYDSLFFVDNASFWNEDFKIIGLGYKGRELFKVSVILKKGKLFL